MVVNRNGLDRVWLIASSAANDGTTANDAMAKKMATEGTTNFFIFILILTY